MNLDLVKTNAVLATQMRKLKDEKNKLASENMSLKAKCLKLKYLSEKYRKELKSAQQYSQKMKEFADFTKLALHMMADHFKEAVLSIETNVLPTVDMLTHDLMHQSDSKLTDFNSNDEFDLSTSDLKSHLTHLSPSSKTTIPTSDVSFKKSSFKESTHQAMAPLPFVKKCLSNYSPSLNKIDECALDSHSSSLTSVSPTSAPKMPPHDQTSKSENRSEQSSYLNQPSTIPPPSSTSTAASPSKLALSLIDHRPHNRHLLSRHELKNETQWKSPSCSNRAMSEPDQKSPNALLITELSAPSTNIMSNKIELEDGNPFVERIVAANANRPSDPMTLQFMSKNVKTHSMHSSLPSLQETKKLIHEDDTRDKSAIRSYTKSTIVSERDKTASTPKYAATLSPPFNQTPRKQLQLPLSSSHLPDSSKKSTQKNIGSGHQMNQRVQIKKMSNLQHDMLKSNNDAQLPSSSLTSHSTDHLNKSSSKSKSRLNHITPKQNLQLKSDQSPNLPTKSTRKCAQNKAYKEPSIRSKLRQGDAHTFDLSSFFKKNKEDIYTADRRKSLHNQRQLSGNKENYISAENKTNLQNTNKIEQIQKGGLNQITNTAKSPLQSIENRQ